jgi:16S rRNA (guanine527-N7)-methyltransferase
MRKRGDDATRSLTEDRARALALTPVAPEVLDRLDRYIALLGQWQRKVNLIAASTLGRVWTRHVADSLQLIPLAPNARLWADLGSGAGFPGVVIACALAGLPGAKVHLVDSNGKKAAFLREAVRVTETPGLVHHQRIADFVASCDERLDVVTARALAPVNQLLTDVEPLMRKGAQVLLLKGQDVGAELEEASIYWKIDADLVTSRTSPHGRIVIVRSAERQQPGRQSHDSVR